MFRRYHVFLIAVLFFAATSAEARPFRPGLVPNGSVSGCLTCHTGFPRPGNGPRNSFGQEVGARVTPGGREAFWGPEIAALDSDGDGVTNGEELGDPEGAWAPGQPAGLAAFVSRPGNPASTPPDPRRVAIVNAQINIEADDATTFTASLDGSQEVPAVAAEATGSGAFSLDGDGLHYRITVQTNNLTGDINAAHFHNAPTGQNGGVVRELSFSRGTASGLWSATDDQPLTDEMIAELMAGNIYVNVHTAENPPGEIRGQVTLSDAASGGMTLAFSRSISGRNADHAWSGRTDSNGDASVDIVVASGGFRRLSANGYYQARLTDATGRVVDTWNSIPLRGGRFLDLHLPVGGRPSIAGPYFGRRFEALGKPLAVSSTVLADYEPVSPAVSLGAVQTNSNGTVDLPVQILGADGLAGGDLRITYNPDLLTFRGGTVEGMDLTVTDVGPGSVSLSFDGLTRSERTGLMLSFDPQSDLFGSFGLTGILFDPEMMPIAQVDIQARLNGAMPADFALFQNQPNPFNPDTQIRYDLPQAGQVRLTIYNALGQEVAQLVNVQQSAGSYAVTWDAGGFASGLYYYRLEAGTFKEVRKMMLVK